MTKPITMLDMSDPNFAEQFRTALGLKPGETIQIIGPQFDRQDGVTPAIPDTWGMILHLSPFVLKAIGCRPWDEPNTKGEQLWLFPAEWYPHIPAGYEVTTISGEQKKFEPGVTDDDRRGGVLAYGVVINVRQNGEQA